jgi:hypothetical protein
VTDEVENPVTIQSSQKLDSPVTVPTQDHDEKSVTTQSPKEPSYTIYIEQDIEPGEPVQSNTSVSGPEWLDIGQLKFKDEEKSILYSPTEWLNDRHPAALIYCLMKLLTPEVAYNMKTQRRNIMSVEGLVISTITPTIIS